MDLLLQFSDILPEFLVEFVKQDASASALSCSFTSQQALNAQLNSFRFSSYYQTKGPYVGLKTLSFQQKQAFQEAQWFFLTVSFHPKRRILNRFCKPIF